MLGPIAFLRRLAMLVPPPRQNLIRARGLLAPNARHRPALVAMAPSPGEEPHRVDAVDSAPGHLDPHTPHGDLESPGASAPSRPGSAYRLPWASLLRRVFAVDVLVCPRCSGRMRLIAVLTDPDSVGRVLSHLGLPTDIPAAAPARSPPQTGLFS